MKTPTPIHAMKPARLHAELSVALRQMLAHESWRYGDCKRRCEQSWPCPDFQRAAKRFVEVALHLELVSAQAGPS